MLRRMGAVQSLPGTSGLSTSGSWLLISGTSSPVTLRDCRDTKCGHYPTYFETINRRNTKHLNCRWGIDDYSFRGIYPTTPVVPTGHTCPEAKTQFIELFIDTINGFLLLLSHIKKIDKAWSSEQKEKKVISLLVKWGGGKMGFWPLFWFGLDWNW